MAPPAEPARWWNQAPGLGRLLRSPQRRALGGGVALRGTVWVGGTAAPRPDSVVLIGPGGRVERIGPAAAVAIPDAVTRIGDSSSWIGPGLIDAHVHLRFAPAELTVLTGLTAVRDLGAPLDLARSVRTGRRAPAGERPRVAVAGPIITATGGYPSRSWGHDVTLGADDPPSARAVVRRLAGTGADVIKVALEPGEAGWPVPNAATLRAIVDAAGAMGLRVVAHALRADMVARAVAGGVAELAHTPTDRLGPELVERIAAAGIAVVSTLQTFFSAGRGVVAAANAADLVASGVVLRYGTDLGNTGTRPGVDPRELDRLADTGLGRLGALRAATEWAAGAPGIRGRTGHIRVGEPAEVVLLPGDPLREPGLWRTVSAVVADRRLAVPADPANAGFGVGERRSDQGLSD